MWLFLCLTRSNPYYFSASLQVQLQINTPSHHQWLLWVPQLVRWKGVVPLGEDRGWHSKFILKMQLHLLHICSSIFHFQFRELDLNLVNKVPIRATSISTDPISKWPIQLWSYKADGAYPILHTHLGYTLDLSTAPPHSLTSSPTVNFES